MKVIVAGSREFTDYEVLKEKLDKILSLSEDVTILSGGARGADRLGEDYAMNNGLEVEVIKAEWDRYGKQAGFLRNKKMAMVADACVVFWDGVSRGSKHMIDLAKKYHLKLRVVMVEPLQGDLFFKKECVGC